MQKIEDLNALLNAQQAFIDALKSAHTLPLEVDNAIRDRLGNTAVFTAGVKGVDTEDVTVNEAGASTHTVLADPVGFLTIEVNGSTYNVPYYS